MLKPDAALRKDRTTDSHLQHRHFAVIARILAALPYRERDKMALHFADHLRHTNPQFDRERFLRAVREV